ncbi:hypothetical protein DEO72_LG5g634 [Vigna unguiculata]|uniref:Uncharacterized protein n=1 Tax=Vigna unguiculata TaxID=3917 RepID=A0A4D6LV89_VIGUN|nr:hypothetical protein DEO72_LG5g634 [Vigna unguiculata]
MCKIEYEGKKECGWPRCTWPFLAEMYPAISWLGCGCDAAEMYLAIPGRDVPGHFWLGCGCDAANMCLGRDVPGLFPY